MEKISQHVRVETGYFGANLGIIETPIGLFLVDAPMNPSDGDRFLKQIQPLGSVAWIIATDHHLDHFMGASFLPGTMVSHREVRGKFMPTFGPIEKIAERVSWSDPEGSERIKDLELKEPVLTFEKTLSFHLDSLEIHLETFPGHTPHTIAVRVEPDGVLFAGDNVVRGMHPFLHDAADPRAWIDSLNRMKALPFDLLVPGHGVVTDRGEIDVVSEKIETLIGRVRAAVNRGMSGEEIEEELRYLSPLEASVKSPAHRAFFRRLERRGIAHVISSLHRQGGSCDG